MTLRPPTSDLQRLAILISGHGSNLQAILDACAASELPARVAAVISDKADAFGLERARRASVPALHKPKLPTQTRAAYDSELADLVASYHPDWVVLAGWMRVLTMQFLGRFPKRVVNLHPALPGAFPGAHAIERAFEAFKRGEIAHTGVMVHLVPDEGVDSGPVLAQEIVPLLPNDTLESVETRIHGVEHRLLVAVLKRLTNSAKRPNSNSQGTPSCPKPSSPSTTKPASSNSRRASPRSAGRSSPPAARPNSCAKTNFPSRRSPTTPARPKSSAGA